jgi:hypothetical protein
MHDSIQSNSHTMVYTDALVVDLKLHAKHYMSCMYIRLYAKFEVLQTTRRLWAAHALTMNWNDIESIYHHWNRKNIKA